MGRWRVWNSRPLRGAETSFEDLTSEQQELVRGAKSPEELLKFAKEAGYELSDEELDSISGGMMWDDVCVGVACIVCDQHSGCRNY